MGIAHFSNILASEDFKKSPEQLGGGLLQAYNLELETSYQAQTLSEKPTANSQDEFIYAGVLRRALLAILAAVSLFYQDLRPLTVD
jgi:hypothetical protein